MRPTRLIVNTDAVARNFREITTRTGADAIAVVKADAYGHGAAPVARACLQAGAKGLAVAIAEEALELRDAGIDAKILVIGAVDADMIEKMVDAEVSFAVYAPETLEIAQAASEKCGKEALGHLKVDTGMRRIGVAWDKVDALLDVWQKCPGVRMEGAFSHFAAADYDAEFTGLQAQRFRAALEMVHAKGFSPVCHMAASSAMLKKELQFDMVRAGIVMYGTGAEGFNLEYAQRLVTRPVRVESISAGETVGYGRKFTAQKETIIATLPIGYGDGYPRILSGRADVLVHGRRAPVVGRVCMDMLMVDVTDIPGVSCEDEFVLMGAQGDERITPDELAEKAMTIPYEIMLGFSSRVRREYEG